MTDRLLATLLVASATLHAADAYFPPPDSVGGWREAKDAKSLREHAGMDLSKLEPAYAVTERSTANGGLVVVRNGWLVFEKYLTRSGPSADERIRDRRCRQSG